MRSPGFFAGALCALSLCPTQLLQATSAFQCAGYAPPAICAKAAAKPTDLGRLLPFKGQVRVLVVFAQFKDETSAQDQAPDFAATLFDPDLPGSLAHFYRTMSFGQLRVEGTVLTRRYTADRLASAYLTAAPGERGRYGEFAQEILRKVDADVDLGCFDNDGPDGIPNSGDDDGYVDYLFINVRSAPRGFIRDGATGIAGLGFEADYASADSSANGDPILIGNSLACGALLQEGTFAQTVGSMAHEFGHGLGLPDLYDLNYDDPEHDSAGAGRWGLMGWGAHGWSGDDGPNPLCAWSLEQLGWIGRDNERLVEVAGDTAGLFTPPLHQGGLVCKIPLRTEFLAPDAVYVQEYLLLEHRGRRASYYDRHLPAEGLLVWHVRPQGSTHEDNKRVDLVCADGLYRDAGYPLGRTPDAQQGGDNLDFWAHDEKYAEAHAGNRGDATDPFDGVRFTHFDLDALPGRLRHPASTGLAMDLRRQGQGLVVDVHQPRWAGTIAERVHWLGEVIVDGDLTVAPEGELVIYGPTRVRVAGSDRLQSGLDPDRCELHVQGALRVHSGPLSCLVTLSRLITRIPTLQPGPVVFEGLMPQATWLGLFPAESARLQVPGGSLILRDAEYGLLESSAQYAALQATAVLAGAEGRPAEFSLLPNFPNPFNAETAIRYALPVASQVRLIIYNALGQEVRQLWDGSRPAGVQEIVWNGKDEGGREVAGGVYLCRLEAKDRVDTRKLLLLK